MIRLAWLQFRPQALTALAALAALAVVLAVTGPQLVHLGSVTSCPTPGECGAAITALTTRFTWGAGSRGPRRAGRSCPDRHLLGCAADHPRLETGTNRLAWTQSITRSPVAGRQARPGWPGQHGYRRAVQPHGDVVVQPDRPGQHEPPRACDVRRARHHPGRLCRVRVALGVTAGALIRRTLPAMAVTLAIFAAIQGYAMPQLIRPHLFPPAHASTALDIAALKGGEARTAS